MKLKEKLVSMKDNVIAGTNGLTLAVLSNPIVNATGNATTTMKNLLNTIIPYVTAIGIPIACVGGFKLVMAFRNDQGDAVPAAARDLAIGIVLTMFGTIWTALSKEFK